MGGKNLKKYYLGDWIEQTPQETKELEEYKIEYEKHKYDDLTYEQKVVALIREKYSIDEELAIQRQRETKVDEFNEYNSYCEKCKSKAKEMSTNAT